MTSYSEKASTLSPITYDAEEAAELFRMVELPKKREDAAGLEQPWADEGYLDVEEEEEEEEGVVEPVLSEDAYSLLYTADFCSRTFFFATCMVLVQWGVLCILLVDLLDLSSDPNQNYGNSNRMSIPQGATLTVTVAQCLGMVLTIVMAAESDFIIGASQLLEGYDADFKVESPNASCLRWFFTGILQCLIGMVFLLDSFILCMRSSTVIDLVLSLASLYFLQEVSKMAYKLADTGMLSDSVKRDCETVKNLQSFTPKSFTMRMLMWKRVLLVLMANGLLAPYAIVISWQLGGRFLCDNLHIQFGDAYEPELAYYSGGFNVQGYAYWDQLNQRAAYLDETKTVLLAYCNAETAWTISRGDPCIYIYKSIQTQTFDVMEVANSPWFFKTDDTGDVEVDWLKIACIECGLSCTKLEYGECRTMEGSENTDKEYCHCNPGRTGPTCELTTKCNYFGLDERTLGSLSTMPGASLFINTKFESMDNLITPNIKLHGRAIYLPYKEKRTFNQDINQTIVESFLLFTGRRWVIFSTPQDDPGDLTRSQFFFFVTSWWNTNRRNPVDLLQSFQTTFKHFTPQFFSSPVNYGEATYGAEPSTVRWVRAKTFSSYSVISTGPDDEQTVAARLLCTDCSQSLCHNGGLCVNGDCECSEYFDGFACERAVDCMEYNGCYRGLGECNSLTKICDNCKNESYGSLCQYGPEQLKDPFYCAKCRAQALGPIASCSNELRQCNCGSDSLYSGEFCNVAKEVLKEVEKSNETSEEVWEFSNSSSPGATTTTTTTTQPTETETQNADGTNQTLPILMLLNITASSKSNAP